MKRLAFIALTLILSLSAQAYTLVIDAGHGGKDPGAIGRKSKEKNINLAVALAFGKLVEQNCPDVKVVYTRKTDVFVELDERANIANRNKADLFVSIHVNSTAAKNGPQGTETYTLGMHRAADNLEVAKRENSVITLESNYEQKYEGFDPKSSESYIIFELMQDKNMEQSVNFAKLVQEHCGTSQQVSLSGRIPGASSHQHAQRSHRIGIHQQRQRGDLPLQRCRPKRFGKKHLQCLQGLQEIARQPHQEDRAI